MQAQATTIDDLRKMNVPVDVVIAAVGGEQTVLTAADLARMAPPSGLVAVDFGVPPNIESAAAEHPNITLYDMDALITFAQEGSAIYESQLGAAREIIDVHLDRLRGEAALRQAAPAIEGVVRHHQALVQASLAEIGGANTLDRDALGQWADRMSRRFLHATLVGVRTLAADAGPAAVESFLRGLASAVPTSSSQDHKERTP
jgi:glutamyl-tRNA reductase